MMVDLRSTFTDERVRQEINEFVLEYFREFIELANRARRGEEVTKELAEIRARLSAWKTTEVVSAISVDLNAKEFERAILDTAYISLYGHVHRA